MSILEKDRATPARKFEPSAVPGFSHFAIATSTARLAQLASEAIAEHRAGLTQHLDQDRR